MFPQQSSTAYIQAQLHKAFENIPPVFFEQPVINIIDYGRFVNSGLLLIGLIISVINYKITFDAYADMVSDASDVQERRWLRLWPASVVVYVAAAIISLSFRVNIAAIVPAVLMDIVIMANILLTISVCKQNDKGT